MFHFKQRNIETCLSSHLRITNRYILRTNVTIQVFQNLIVDVCCVVGEFDHIVFASLRDSESKVMVTRMRDQQAVQLPNVTQVARLFAAGVHGHD